MESNPGNSNESGEEKRSVKIKTPLSPPTQSPLMLMLMLPMALLTMPAPPPGRTPITIRITPTAMGITPRAPTVAAAAPLTVMSRAVVTGTQLAALASRAVFRGGVVVGLRLHLAAGFVVLGEFGVGGCEVGGHEGDGPHYHDGLQGE